MTVSNAQNKDRQELQVEMKDSFIAKETKGRISRQYQDESKNVFKVIWIFSGSALM